ncbi:MAG: helix-turn-helix domain containing protein [Anaerolineae bacterium]|nr:helix-turn-helix domain containing protein [Anaerolineae bacterium]
MVLYVRELRHEEVRRLRVWISGSDQALEHRARLVLLSAEGYRIPEIAHILDAHPANLRKWIHRFNEHGCRGLVTVRSGGAKPRFTREQKARIVSLAKTRPRELGLNYTSWTLHKLAEQARARDIVDQISHECVRQILRDADCSYHYQVP